MNRQQGNSILNKLKDGQDIDDESISAALIATGDLSRCVATRDGGAALDTALRGDEEDLWPQASRSLVAADAGADPTRPRRWCSAYLAGRNEQARQ